MKLTKPIQASSKRFSTDANGTFATKFALLVPVLLGLAAGGMDFVAYNQQKAAMQAAADAAAIAAVREASLKGWTSDVADSVAEAVVDSNYSARSSGKILHKVSAVTDETSRTITVAVEQDHYPYFASSIFPSPQLSVQATATAAGSTNVCVIGLDETQSGTVGLENSSELSAPRCAVYSNSKALDGLSAVKSSMLEAQLVCSAGGVEASFNNFTRDPVTSCPQIADPLESRPPPSFASYCDHDNLVIDEPGKTVVLMPGVYCNGLTIKETEVVFEKGVYIIKDGPFTLAANARMYGRGAGFFFTGEGANFSLESDSSVNLEAPENGPLAGLLFYQDRNAKEADFILRSNSAGVLVGTIYLPNGNFIIDTVSRVADASAYTAIVSRTLRLKRQPYVVLNTDYGATDVPVPAGIGGSGNSTVRLLK